MARLTAGALLLVGCAANEALSSSMKPKSKAEIMSEMSDETAVRTLLRMNRTTLEPALESFIQTKFGHVLHRSHLRRSTASVQPHRRLVLLQESETSADDEDEQEGDVDDEDDTNGIRQATAEQQKSKVLIQLRAAESTGTNDAATDQLNTMIKETAEKLELEQMRCSDYEHRQHQSMEQLREDIASFNSLAAEARGNVIKAQGQIGFLGFKVSQVREQTQGIHAECYKEKGVIKKQIEIVKSDIKVMAQILALTSCNSALFLVQCSHCGGAVMLQHDKIQPLLNSLESDVAKEYAHRNLKLTYQESLHHSEPIALTEESVNHMRQYTGGGHRLRRHLQDPATEQGSSQAVTPPPPVPSSCVPTAKCTIGASPDCERLRDRFLVIQSGISDKFEELKQNLVDMDNFCADSIRGFEAQIDGMEERMREEQTNLAVATKDQNQAEGASSLKGQQHEKMVKEHSKEMKECCDNQNNLRSESCALEKIRGELKKLAGTSHFMTDCEVSDWRSEECSKSCGGGTMKKSRTIIVHPAYGGTPCLPLAMEESCNDQPCPVDCRVTEWGGWSSCSAECGGGVRERSRNVKVMPHHGGEPCEQTEDEEPCGVESCDRDCLLGEWTPWSQCSKACDGGVQRSSRAVVSEARGTGRCFEPLSEMRTLFQPCNTMSCAKLLPPGREVLKCNSKVDLIVMLDGSGSLRQFGWTQTQAMGKTLVSNLEGGDDKVMTSLMLFSGPKTWSSYMKCTGREAGTPDLEKDCGIKWVSHFSSDPASLAGEIDGLAWPRATTLTSVALGEADSEIKNGREDATTVVVVITDGWPMSMHNTYVAAMKLQEKARVIWVPVGSNAPIGLIQEMASQPIQDHVIQVPSFDALDDPATLNKIITDTCPVVS